MKAIDYTIKNDQIILDASRKTLIGVYSALGILVNDGVDISRTVLKLVAEQPLNHTDIELIHRAVTRAVDIMDNDVTVDADDSHLQAAYYVTHKFNEMLNQLKN